MLNNHIFTNSSYLLLILMHLHRRFAIKIEYDIRLRLLVGGRNYGYLPYNIFFMSSKFSILY